MPKWIKSVVGLLLLPLCIGIAQAVMMVMRAGGDADAVMVALVAGAACWLVIFLLLPKPYRAYVVGHELTHALWTWLFGGRVRKFKATARGGHVVVTKTNFLITLAPYFFPFYAAVVVAVFLAGHLIWDWTRYRVLFHLLLGAAYAFHVTLTWHALRTRQTDITDQGYVFSAVIIWLGNAAVLLFGVPLVTSQVGWLEALKLWVECTAEVLQRLSRLF